jgi:hypothetical protein
MLYFFHCKPFKQNKDFSQWQILADTPLWAWSIHEEGKMDE